MEVELLDELELVEELLEELLVEPVLPEELELLDELEDELELEVLPEQTTPPSPDWLLQVSSPMQLALFSQPHPVVWSWHTL